MQNALVGVSNGRLELELWFSIIFPYLCSLFFHVFPLLFFIFPYFSIPVFYFLYVPFLFFIFPYFFLPVPYFSLFFPSCSQKMITFFGSVICNLTQVETGELDTIGAEEGDQLVLDPCSAIGPLLDVSIPRVFVQWRFELWSERAIKRSSDRAIMRQVAEQWIDRTSKL